jgi:16S rRNA processing protein RimM
MRRSRKANFQTELPQELTGSPLPGEPVFIAVGKLCRPHGFKGEILMDVMTDFPERLRVGKKVFIGPLHTALRIASVRSTNQGLLLSFEGFDSDSDVGQHRNQIVYVTTADLPKLPDGEYYHHQLIGLRVQTESGDAIGVLSEIIVTGANDVYVVKNQDGKEELLPAVKNIILSVDLSQGVMVVHPPEWGG